MTLPWQTPAPLPAADIQYFPRIADAEAAIVAAGFVRDTTRHIWVGPGNRTAKVMRENNSQFYIQWG